MNQKTMHVGSNPVVRSHGQVEGGYVTLGAEKPERFYRISEFDRMETFFISLVSSSNLWLFLSTRGGLTAGRQDAASALFPYYTEDKIHDNSLNTGPRTIVRVERATGDEDSRNTYLWEPFSDSARAFYRVSRNLYKNVTGDKILFEEINEDLGLAFRYSWLFSDRFGLVKRSELENVGSETAAVDLVDGIENILPSGVAEYFQNVFSCLGDAYKQNEIAEDSDFATFSLSSIPGDSTDPAESLRTTVCWSTLSREVPRLLSSLQLDAFRQGADVEPERKICGRRGAYFIHDTPTLDPGGTKDWLIVADVNYGPSELADLEHCFSETSDLKELVLEDVDCGTQKLSRIVASADGLQHTGDALGSAHHFSNVLFNVMRGGIFESSYSLPVADLESFLQAFNAQVHSRHAGFLSELGEAVDRQALLEKTDSLDDPDLTRLILEYLPLSFSRRHGDPSRPWNRFSIRVKASDGSRLLSYEGNWRDIFQNWEALCLSFPEYIESIVAKFVNTTTVDGYNPYRIGKDGYDWEEPAPDEPWANIGYWGDHQLIYLVKLLELSQQYHPGELESLLDDEVFVYADVPYDIKPYADLLADPRHSIAYSTDREERIAAREDALGFDGKYAVDRSGAMCRANLAEKLLVPLLAKVANLVPGGGFWMNTQRPEWNDANNALAGYGASMVTLCYARRFACFFRELLGNADADRVRLSVEIRDWFESTKNTLEGHRDLLERSVEDKDRRALLDDLGGAAERYRLDAYGNGLSGDKADLATADLTAFLDLLVAYLEHSIDSSRRPDGLFDAYNVIDIEPAGIAVKRLQSMLEGQVAVLSSGYLGADETLKLLEVLRKSAMYREDQHTYLLYPNKELPGFLEKNTIPDEMAQRSELLGRLVADSNSELVERDTFGRWHFNPGFGNVRDVMNALDSLVANGYADLVEKERELVAEIFESIFHHAEYTGRSGTFYGYEGLGCIYWHMISKLLLAVQESCLAAYEEGSSAYRELAARYYDVRAGIGFNKSPDVYGAFPTDPYSHTPGYAGAKQPGMTGQVKEEVITRQGELGLLVREGAIRFDPYLLRENEFHASPACFEYTDVHGDSQRIDLDVGALAFTYCQVPIVYERSKESNLTVHFHDGTRREFSKANLDREMSREIFRRTGKVRRLDVRVSSGLEI